MNESDQTGGLRAILSAFVHGSAVVSLAFAGTAEDARAETTIYRPNKEATNMRGIIHLITIILLAGCAAADMETADVAADATRDAGALIQDAIDDAEVAA
jgi:hypothetical protein